MKRIIEWLRSLFREEYSPSTVDQWTEPSPKKKAVKKTPKPKDETKPKTKTEAKPRGAAAPKKTATKKTPKQK
jgi:hypothetical protein